MAGRYCAVWYASAVRLVYKLWRRITMNKKNRTKLFSMRMLKKTWVCYLFILPMVLYVLLFNYVPMYGIQLAFKDYRASDGIWGSAWVGMKHFQTFFDSW